MSNFCYYTCPTTKAIGPRVMKGLYSRVVMHVTAMIYKIMSRCRSLYIIIYTPYVIVPDVISSAAGDIKLSNVYKNVYTSLQIYSKHL